MTDEQIAETRRLRALGMSLSKIGRKLGANYMAVWRVVNDVPLPARTTKAANYWPQVRIRAEIRHRNGR